ncbi:unnamed protein product [Rotaria magnacalcarata]|uniref:Uncharacterized protein n=1 Tax=Rotaria magnacalcarata TaxID=392030 RepID=A0A818X9G1_9BILA|nr:unnamed protein product [Rotaria magnacalcarata]CAF3739440.1 unnamed protein product [Rotaria magnacalcarata]
MLSSFYLLTFQFGILISEKPYVIITSDQSEPLDIEPLIIDVHIPEIEFCQYISTSDCKLLIRQMLKCQRIIFNDPGFSFQQYNANINAHQQILVKYQSMCEDTQNDYSADNAFDYF